MDKGPSEFAKYWTSEFNEAEHYKDHGHEMGYSKIKDYSKAAVRFAQSKERGILVYVGRNGAIVRYFPKTDEFVIVSKTGNIVTYFAPDDIQYAN